MIEAATRRLGEAKTIIVNRLRVLVVDGPDSKKTFDLPKSQKLSIGSAPDNDIVLGDRTVSRYHVEIERTPLGIRVRDLGSSNGTQLQSLWINDVIVPPGTCIQVGATTLRLEDADAASHTVLDSAIEIPTIVGKSQAIAEVRGAIARLAKAHTSVLIGGETGTGKELVARAIHEHSDRAKQPFVVVDCGSLPATLIASELFGHERGAFTSADKLHIGAFERAQAGTIFLDEVGELPPQVQAALLGVLERREFRRLGGEKQLQMSARVLAATNRDLRAEVNKGTFRADLYYRLSITKITLPPLRERPEDIEDLVAFFIDELAGQSGHELFSAEALATLRRQNWSGNIRELRNVVEAALAMGQLQIEGEPSRKNAGPHDEPDALPPYRHARAEALTSFELQYLTRLMEEAGRNASEAARRARMDRPYLLSLLKRHGMR
ncbi:MAG: sigma 54-interacting transcriptional regulator [Deltaproteobacteria bacterium]|nr:sigma 54-interacting transcriptional regulator [Deltaproteobacteria bacterium]